VEIKIVKFGLRFYCAISLRRVREVTGVNSQVDEDTHFLMWDFDEIPLPIVIDSLKAVQRMFNLPAISIVQTKANNYHGYCFRACSFIEARGIIAFTPNIDRHYLAAGCGRGYFTLRFTDVKGQEFKHVMTLTSDIEPDLDYTDINSFVQYTKATKAVK